jgi:hypothetical protein
MSFLRLNIVVFGILTASFASNIKSIDDNYANQMQGISYFQFCPVLLDKLRIVNVKYLGFDDAVHYGDIVVHNEVAVEISKIFEELFDIKYPIKQIFPIEKYNGSDFDSIEADNTSAFNCRKASDSNKYSKHSYGKAIDINPLENPYIYTDGKISHKASYLYRTRILKDTTPENKAILLSSSEAVAIFKKYGWKWGGDWKNIKDYQHFQK